MYCRVMFLHDHTHVRVQAILLGRSIDSLIDGLYVPASTYATCIALNPPGQPITACIYIYIYIYTHAYIYICIYVSVYVYMYV